MFHEESKRLRKDVIYELDPPCIYESQEDLCILELWESHVQNKQFLENCTAADNLPLKNSACSEAAHTLLLNGFNLGCSMKRTTLSSDASNSGETLEVVLVSFLLSLGFFIDILTV